MKQVLFVTGEPKSGKSYLATELAKNHSFVPLSVDDVYVNFVRDKCDFLFFKELNRYIYPHYKHILSERNYSKEQFGRDFVVEWHEYLLQQIEELATQKDRVVVEGYLLKDCTDCADHLREKLQGKVQIFPIQVADRTYTWKDQPLTVGQVAALGSNAPPEAWSFPQLCSSAYRWIAFSQQHNQACARQPQAADSALHASRTGAQSRHGFRLKSACKTTAVPSG